ncbi:MAG TPA: bis(5'-nucleosyl)-tetraphosphatase [Tepidisphaeraceae bacterium]
MTLERSAGVLVFRQPPDAARLFLLLDYGHHWDYPKGHVEAGEDDPTAARRELVEETGITQIELLADFAREMTYVFRGRRGNLIKKTVIFFLGRTDSDAVTLSHEHVGYAWLTAQEAMAKLTYANAKAMLTAAIERLEEGRKV